MSGHFGELNSALRQAQHNAGSVQRRLSATQRAAVQRKLNTPRPGAAQEPSDASHFVIALLISGLGL